MQFRHGLRAMLLLVPATVAVAEDPAPSSPAAGMFARVRQAQDDAIRELLASDRASDVAVGCSTVSAERRASFRPEVAALAARAVGLPFPTSHQVLSAAFEIGASTPSSVALHFCRTDTYWCRVPAVLSARSAPVDEILALWDALDGDAIPLEAVVLGNRLADQGARGFASRLLARMRFTSAIEVTDDRSSEGELIEPSGDVACDCVTHRSRSDPPLVEHRLSVEASEGATVVSAGPIPVFCSVRRRSESEVGHGPAVTIPAQQACRRLILAMLGEGEHGRRIPDGVHVAVAWTNEAALRQSVARAGARAAEMYWSLVGAAVARGVLSREEASSLSPTLRRVLLDCREEPRELPEIPDLPVENPYARR